MTPRNRRGHGAVALVTPDHARRLLRRLLLMLLIAVMVFTPTAGAQADQLLGNSTTGTASTVSPSTIALGGTLTYTLSGFPQGAKVEILIDDGELAPGGQTGVVGQLTVGEDGTHAGAVELPPYVAKGTHWLRFRVTEGEDIPTNTVRTLDYTNKSPYFTVADVTVIGGESQASPPHEPAKDSQTVGDVASSSPTVTATAPVVAAGGGSDAASSGDGWISASMPVVTTVVLALAAVLAVLSAIMAVERRRLLAYERQLEYAARR
ncbi:DNA-directed RNA polymerase II [Actinomyces qiguomingii]|uniref:DNA-directed RNA polymerase II n=1 Tax=Actinomyces qiguomingii TaxID=2057800 RepID=UPI000CA02702|nr:DNA-directed RNA polymerase II [Actinomyces qiguomingii]